VPNPLDPLGKVAHVVHHHVKGIHTPDVGVELWVGRIGGDAEFIQSRLDEGPLIRGFEQDGIGVEEDVWLVVPALEIVYHGRQIVVEEWFAHAVQDHTLQLWDLVHQRAELVQCQVASRFQYLKGAHAGPAARIAAVGHFDIQFTRQ
jgi:hypothetical protein